MVWVVQVFQVVQVVRCSGDKVVRWSGGQVVRRLGGQVVRAVKVFMMAKLVQVV